MQKSCSNCLNEAQFSLVAIISTVGVSGRMQKSSKVVLFCAACLQKFNERLCAEAFCKAVNSTYTELSQQLKERTQHSASAAK